MEILITGGNGFLGRSVILALLERGESVRVLALPKEDTSWLERQGVRVCRGDIRNADVLVGPMQGVSVVFHLAAMMGAWCSLDEYHSVNVLGTGNVCRTALEAGVSRVIHVSTAMVYNMAIGRALTEDDPFDPLDEPYSMTKAEGDRLVQRMIAEDHLPAVIIRPGTLFGPGDRLNFGRVADRIRAGQGVIIGSGDNALPLVFVTDVVQGLLLAMDREAAAGQAYNIGNDQPLTQADFLSAVADEIGAAPPSIHVPYYPLYAAAWAAERLATLSSNRIPPFVTRHGVKVYGADNHLAIEKARCDLGYAPQVGLHEGVRMAAAWYQHQESGTLAAAPVGAPAQ